MMSLEQIREWATGGESETVELKRSTAELRAAAKSLCAMLNHRGGRVLFGVDKERRIVGQHVSDRTIEELAQELGEIDPPVYPSVERVAVGNGREVVAVTVAAGPNKPYSYRGRASRRVGNTNQ